MKYSKDAIELSMHDAFKALNEIDDSFDDALRNQYQGKLNEGVSVYLNSPYNQEELETKLEEDSDDTLKVIDIDADTVEHLRDGKDYVGQLIAKCNVCQALRFLDVDDMKPSEEDPDVYNVEEECPHCHSEGKGFVVVGQVGQAPKEEATETEEVETEATAEGSEETVDAEEEVTLDNDEAASEGEELELEAEETETDEAGEDETEESSSEEVNVYEEEPEQEYDETDAEDDTLDLDLPELGDEIDQDDVKEDDTEDKEKKEDEEEKEVKESLNEEDLLERRFPNNFPFKINQNRKFKQFHDVWDFKTWDGLQDFIINAPQIKRIEIIDKAQSVINDCDVILTIRKNDDGTYNVENQTEYTEILNDFYHIPQDKVLNIARDAYFGTDETNENYIKVENKATVCESVNDLLNNIVNSDCIDDVCCLGGEDGEDVVYNGSYDELPSNVRNAKMKGFNVCGNTFIINIDTLDRGCDFCLKSLLDKFTDDTCDNISLCDVDDDCEIFCGNKADAIDKYGDCAVWSIDKPKAIQFITDCADVTPWGKEEVEHTEADDLIADIIRSNGLKEARLNNPKCVEYWIAESIKNGEDLDIIYENYVDNQGDDLKNRFKESTGYKDELDVILEKKGLVETAPRNDDVQEAVEEAKKLLKEKNAESVVYGYTLRGKFYKLPKMYACRDYDELQLASDLVKNKYNVNGSVYTLYADKVREDLHDWSREDEEAEKATIEHDANRSIMIEEVKEWAKHDLENNSILIDTPEDKETFKQLLDSNGFTDYDLNDLFDWYLTTVGQLDENKNKEKAETLNEEVQLKASSDMLNTGADKLDKELTSKGYDVVVVTDDAYPGVIGVMVKDEETQKKIKPEIDVIFKSLNWKPNKVQDINDEDGIGIQYGEISLTQPIGLKESVVTKDLKDRKELSEALKELKNNNRPYNVSRSLKEGYRYQLTYNEDLNGYNSDDYANDTLFAEGDKYEEEQEAIKEINDYEEQERLNGQIATDLFDEELNEYFDKTYDQTVVYETVKATTDKTGTIVLEGLLNSDDKKDVPVKFLLEPVINEGLENTTMYRVSNTLSEEVFEFSIE